jgi:hypothetical protein
VPVALYCQSDEEAGGTATHHVTFDGCTFDNCEIETIEQYLSTGFMAISGNVHDYAVRNCLFDNAGVRVRVYGNAGIDTGGNVLGARPDRPRKGVILRNVFRDMGGIGWYAQGIHDHLVEGNIFLRCGYGSEVAYEAVRRAARAAA